MAIQLRRGSYSDLDTSRLLAGELAVVLSGDPTVSDGKMLYIAFASGDTKRLATWEDAAALIAAYLDDALELVVQSGNDAINVTEVNGTYSVKHKALYTQGKDGADPIASNIGDRTSLGNTTLSPGGSFWVPCVDIDKYGHVKGLGYRKLTLPGSGGYATLEQAGIVKPDGETINVDVDGTISTVPYEHPSYTALTGKPASNQTPSFGSTFTVSQIESDETGHVKKMTDRTVKIPSTTATTSSAGLMSSTDKSKLNGIANNATANTASTSTPKMDGTASYGSASAYARGDHVHPTDTSRMAASLKGAANGVAELDANGKVPSSQLPSYVDDVLEYAGTSAFPATGETDKIYVDTTDNKTYRWGGSSYVEISASLALGETDSTAYRGDRGKAAYDHASAKGSAFLSGLYKITTNAEGHVTAASSVEKSDITALGIPGEAYTLPTMGADTKGGAKVGDGLAMTGDVLATTNDMGLSGTSVGQVPVVATVDANGVPTSWSSVLLIWRTLTVTVTTHDAQTVTGVTVTVRLGGPTGEVLGTATYNGSPLTFLLQHGTDYYVSVSDDLRMYGPPSTASGTILANDASATLTYAALESVLERDSVTGEYTNASVTEYFQRTRTGLVYGTTEPLSVATALTKTGANASLTTPVGGYIGTPAVDPYEDLGPFLYRTANGYVDSDGVPHITDIEGIDNTFARDGSNGNVWQIHGIIYEKWSTTATDNVHDITDTPATGFAPHPKCYLPDGTLRPYMVTAAYPLGKNPYDNNAPASISGVAPRTRDVSHNAGITICDTANTGYSLKSTYDDWYIKTMFEMKYATKHSQSVYAGCTNYNLQYNPAVAETGVKRVIVTNAQAANFVVGSNCQFGTRTGASDNDRNRTQNYNIFDKVTITSIEAYDTNNSAINFDAPNTFDSATTCLLSTAPWTCGCLDAVVGDGTPSVAGRTNGKEPFKIQGIEVAHGMYEVLGDIIISNDGTTGWTPYVCADTKNAATSLTANYTACADALPTNTSDGWKYPAHTVYSNGLRYGADMSASSSTGLNDGTYTNKLATTGTREWPGLGNLGSASYAGLWCVNGGTLGNAYWNIGSRLSGTGRAAA